MVDRRTLIKGGAALAAYAALEKGDAAAQMLGAADGRTFPRRKAATLLRVNRNHQLARGLFDCIVFGPGGNWGFTPLGKPFAQPVFAGTIGGKWVNNPEPGARRNYQNGSNGTTWCTIGNTQLVNRYAGDFSVFNRFIAHNLPNANNFPYVQAAASNNASLCPVYNTSFNQSFFFIGDGNDAAVYTTGFTTGAISNHGMSRAGSTATYYANGKSIGSGTNAGIGNDVAPIEFGTFNAAAVEMDITHIVFYTWTRALSAAEQLQLALDPLCFLTPVFDPAIVGAVISAAPPTCPITLALMGVGC